MATKMVLHCPQCGKQHIDKGEWETREHIEHLCEHCGHKWKPKDYPTVGVDEIVKTVLSTGQHNTDLAHQPFDNMPMICVICGAKQMSSRDTNTDWRALLVNGITYYACVNEFPPDGSSSDLFQSAYMAVIVRIGELVQASHRVIRL